MRDGELLSCLSTRAPARDEPSPSCQSAVETTRAYLTSHNAELVAASSADEVTLADVALRAIEAWEDAIFFRATDLPRSLLARDEGMADTFMALRDLHFPTGKAILWAHGGHLMSHSQTASGFYGGDGRMVMGTFLREQLGESYQAFALIGYQVDINWPGYASPPCKELTPPTAADAVENLLHPLATPSMLIDLDFPGASTPFLDPAQSYNLFENDESVPMVAMKPREQFRGLVYLDHSPPMQATQWSNCGEEVQARFRDGGLARGGGTSGMWGSWLDERPTIYSSAVTSTWARCPTRSKA